MPNFVFGCGNPNADLFFLGEAPGYFEDFEGIPFVGKSGEELNRFLDGIRLPERDDCYITNVFKFRPPDNRDPTKEEIAEHAPLLLDELQSIRPRVVCCLGRIAASWMLGRDVEMDTSHGMAFKVRICLKCGKVIDGDHAHG